MGDSPGSHLHGDSKVTASTPSAEIFPFAYQIWGDRESGRGLLGRGGSLPYISLLFGLKIQEPQVHQDF